MYVLVNNIESVNKLWSCLSDVVKDIEYVYLNLCFCVSDIVNDDYV